MARILKRAWRWRWCRVSGFGFLGCLGIWGAGAQSGRVEKLGEAGQGTGMSKSKVEGLRVEGMRVLGGVGGGGGVVGLRVYLDRVLRSWDLGFRMARAGESYANTQHVAASVGLSPTCTECWTTFILTHTAPNHRR